MTEADSREGAPPAVTAGTLLRRAREKQGMHIGVLATAIKVAPRKLEALEADRYDELPDATFTRALAQTVCRTLKTDPAPVLALLPRAGGDHRLEQVAEGINAPFRERDAPPRSGEWPALLRPSVVVPLLLVVLAGVVWLWPQRLADGPARQGSSAPPASAAVMAPAPPAAASAPPGAMPGASAAVVVEAGAAVVAQALPAVVALAGAAAPAPAGPAVAAAAAPPSLLQVRTSAASWVEVIDGGGRSLISRIVGPGESVDLDGALPLRVRVGNAAATQLSLRGQAVDLAPSTRDNVARLDLR